MKRGAFFFFFFIANIAYWFSLSLSALSTKELRQFAHSFLHHYECSTTGKFTREYHPYLLEKTATSLIALEDHLHKAGFDIHHRITLMGYEEQGMPRYTSDYKERLLSDEELVKTEAGWGVRMFNRFGLLTAYLLKDVNQIKTYLSHDLPSFHHIDPHLIELFDGHRTIFQKHAFGDAFCHVMDSYEALTPLLAKGTMQDVYQHLMRFWQVLYEKQMRIDGKAHMAGTQDILFSMAYLDYLKRSHTPLTMFYLGPDITYPIEKNALHAQETTFHSQQFVKTFVQKLVPCEGKRTAYVFCSFVDGVGKSTMLGNITNWMNHADAIGDYEHVDNSSSQLATLFEYDTDVYIADLPAQISHFTYKPDGFVYVSIEALQKEVMASSHIKEHIVAHADKFIIRHHTLRKELKERLEKEGYQLDLYEKENPELSYLANTLLLEVEDEWISCQHEGKYYLFSQHDPSQVRVRVALGGAPSHGLKNAHTAQMIFSQGLRFPLAYESFLKDLSTQLKEYNIEKVVMVDFLSMYSRSSRENVRVNYLIQQMALLKRSFKQRQSFYGRFVNNEQLLARLACAEEKEQFAHAVLEEVFVRMYLYEALVKGDFATTEGIPLATITHLLQEKLSDPFEQEESVRQEVSLLINSFLNYLEETYGNTKEYLHIQTFSPSTLVHVTQLLSDFFTQKIVHPHLPALWETYSQSPVLQEIVKKEEGSVEGILSNQKQVKVICQLPASCADRLAITPVVRLLRSCWHASIMNVLGVQNITEDAQLEIHATMPIIPMGAVTCSDGSIAIVQEIFPDYSGAKKDDSARYTIGDITADIKNPLSWTVFDERFYLKYPFSFSDTYSGVYSYGYTLPEKEGKEDCLSYTFCPIQEALHILRHDKGGYGTVLSTTELYTFLRSSFYFRSQLESYERHAHENQAPEVITMKKQEGRHPLFAYDSFSLNPKVSSVASHQVEGIVMYDVLALMIDYYVHDPDADIVIRSGSKEDFESALALLHAYTFPLYAQIYVSVEAFKEPVWKRLKEMLCLSPL